MAPPAPPRPASPARDSRNVNSRRAAERCDPGRGVHGTRGFLATPGRRRPACREDPCSRAIGPAPRVGPRLAPDASAAMLSGERPGAAEMTKRPVTEPRRRDQAAPRLRAGQPFVPLVPACRLSGVMRPSSGASQSRRGRVAMAGGGALFLDEVAESTKEPLGSAELVHADFRYLAATSRGPGRRGDRRAPPLRPDQLFRLQSGGRPAAAR